MEGHHSAASDRPGRVVAWHLPLLWVVLLAMAKQLLAGRAVYAPILEVSLSCLLIWLRLASLAGM